MVTSPGRNLDKLMTVREVAIYLGISESYVYKNAGELGGMKVGGQAAFSQIRIGRVAGTPPPSAKSLRLVSVGSMWEVNVQDAAKR